MTLNQIRLTRFELEKEVETLFRRDNSDKKSVGIELETTPFKYQQDINKLNVKFNSPKKDGIIDILKNEFKNSTEIFYAPNNEGTPQFINATKGNMTFEPGGQIEYSSSALKDIKSAISETAYNLTAISKALSKNNLMMYFGAVNPWHSTEDVDLKLKKDRYLHMDQFLKSIGVYGQQMMRLTSSIQVNLDLGKGEEMEERWKVANLLSPIITAIFGNSPFAAGQNTAVKSFRSMIWQNMDHSRTGMIYNSNEDIIGQYLKFALNSFVILYPDQNGKKGFWGKHITFQDWFENGINGYFPNLEDWKNHLTTLFPEVRPKGFFEFRCIDGQSRAWWSVPAILLSRIMYSPSGRAKIMDLLDGYRDQLIEMQWKASIMGVNAFRHLCDAVFKIALESGEYMTEDCIMSHAEQFYQEYTFKGLNPADKLLKINNSDVYNLFQYLEFENQEVEISKIPTFAFVPGFNPDNVPEKLHTESKNASCGCC